MAANNEDALPDSYKYAWSKDSELPLQEFLKKYKPSMVQNDGTKPWIWVRGSDPTKKDQGVSEAVGEAVDLLKEATEKVESIKNDASIPLRSNKKTGAKSKKEVREQVQAQATESLKDIATKHGYVSGKWLIFASPDKIDMIWSNVATSLVSGPLSSTSAYLAKVATSPEHDMPNYQHIICLYMPDVYDKDNVTEIMRILLRNHGVALSGVKSNLYTSIGIDSKHPSGIQSTTWKNISLLKESEIKKLKDAFFAEVATTKPVRTMNNSATTSKPEAEEKSLKSKPKLKKKGGNDPFVSDSDDDEQYQKQKEDSKAKRTQNTKAKSWKDSGDDSDDEEKEGRKQSLKAKKPNTKAKHQKTIESDDYEEEEKKPKKAFPERKAGGKAKRLPEISDDEEDRPPKKRVTSKK